MFKIKTGFSFASPTFCRSHTLLPEETAPVIKSLLLILKPTKLS